MAISVTPTPPCYNNHAHRSPISQPSASSSWSPPTDAHPIPLPFLAHPPCALLPAAPMEGALSFVDCIAFPPPYRSMSPEYSPVSPFWTEGSPERAPSTTLRSGPKVPSPRRAASPDFAPLSDSRDTAVYREHTPASPEYTPVSRYWKLGSPEYTPATPAIREASSCYTLESPDYTPPGRVGSPDYTPSTQVIRAASVDYTPVSPGCTPASDSWREGSTASISAAFADYAPASPEYTPVSTFWRPGSSYYTLSRSSPTCRAFSPEYIPQMPRERAPSPDYSPSTPPPSVTHRRRHHPYQKSSASTCASRAGNKINGVQRHFAVHGN